MPSSNYSGFEPGVPPSTRRALLDQRKQVTDLDQRLGAIEGAVPPTPLPSARGVVAWKRGTLSSAALATATPLTIYTLAAPLVAGRMYELTITARAIISSGAGVRIQASVAPAIAGFTVDAYAFVGSAAYGNMSWDALLVPTVTQSHTFTVTATSPVGTGTIWTELNSGIWVKDIGPAIPSS